MSLPDAGGSDTPGHVAFTIATCSYLAGATLWARSMAVSRGEMICHIVVADLEKSNLPVAVSHAERCGLPVNDLAELLIGIDEIALQRRDEVFARYQPIELCTAVKAACFFSFRERYPGAVIHYFDPDIYIYDDLEDLRKFSERHSFTLIPHWTVPPMDGHKLYPLDVIRAGLFNFGYLGVNFSASGVHEIMAWWMRVLEKDCRVALEEGIFVDQSWGAAMVCHPGAGILRHPGYNAAYWNLHERAITEEYHRFLVNRQKLQFFHFSGYNPKIPERLSLHQDRHLLENIPPLKRLCDGYGEMLLQSGWTTWRRVSAALKDELIETGNGADKALFPPLREALRQFQHHATREIWKTKHGKNVPHPRYIRLGVAWWLTFLERVIAYTLFSHPDIRKLTRQERLAKWKVYRHSGTIPRRLLLAGVHFYTLAALYRFSPLEKRVKKPKVAPSRRTYETMIHRPYVVAGYVSSETGVGESCRGILRGFAAAGLEVAAVNLPSGYARDDDREFSPTPAATIASAETVVVCVNADEVRHIIGGTGRGFIGKCRRKIGYWYWETAKFPAKWRHLAGYFDEIWVASEFVKRSLDAADLGCPVRLVRPTLRPRPSIYPDRQFFDLPPDRQLCLIIFDATSLLGRKNPAGALEALRKVIEFDRRADIEVVLKVTNLSENDQRRLSELAGSDMRIHWITQYLTANETFGLIAACDCLVSLHRSEGLGLSLLEAMQAGVPVVATAYSGNVDFLTESTGWPVRYQLIEAKVDDGPYFGSEWAEPDISHAVESIRAALSDGETKRRKLAEAQLKVEQLFGRKATSERLAEVLQTNAWSDEKVASCSLV